MEKVALTKITYDENDNILKEEVLEFPKKWLLSEIAPQTLESFLNEYTSDVVQELENAWRQN